MARRLFYLLLILVLLPYGLTLLYRFVPPLSLPVLGHWLRLESVEKHWVCLRGISRHLPRSVIAAEDGQFCLHNGVDWKAVEKTIERAEARGRITHGASTVTMQVAKNLFLWYLPPILRKPFEVPLAMWIDLTWPKGRVMEVYLNIAQFGKHVYGAEAAARHYFHKPAAGLTLRESALLTAILPNPEARSASRPSAYVSRYAGSIAGRSARIGLLSQLGDRLHPFAVAQELDLHLSLCARRGNCSPQPGWGVNRVIANPDDHVAALHPGAFSG